MSEGFLNELLLVIAIAFGTINVVGGFLVTDRMLEMFKKRPKPSEKRREGQGLPKVDAIARRFLQDPDFIQFLYIVAFVLFILGMRQRDLPDHRAPGQLDRGGRAWRSRWSPRS